MRKFKLPELPYPKDSLKPFLSSETLEYHYEKHHKAYIDGTNKLLEANPMAWGDSPTLEELVMKAEDGLFNQAAQAWNHTFYWHCMTPEQQELEAGPFKNALAETFGSMEGFSTKFVEKGTKQFGSGWVWLTKDRTGRLDLISTSNAENPLRKGQHPLLVCDVWEHAYYIDFRNERKKYLEDFLQCVNWRFVEENYTSPGPANMTRFS